VHWARSPSDAVNGSKERQSTNEWTFDREFWVAFGVEEPLAVKKSVSPGCLQMPQSESDNGTQNLRS